MLSDSGIWFSFSEVMPFVDDIFDLWFPSPDIGYSCVGLPDLLKIIKKVENWMIHRTSLNKELLL